MLYIIEWKSPAFEQLHLEQGLHKNLFAPVALDSIFAFLLTTSTTCAIKICLNSLQPIRLHNQLNRKLHVSENCIEVTLVVKVIFLVLRFQEIMKYILLPISTLFSDHGRYHVII